MNFEFMTREMWDAVVIGMVLIALALAAVRIYADFARKGVNDE